jgi:peptidoglycan/LPS O-acetylase OafA/YrhL
MFFALLIVTFALALAVSAGLVRLFSNPLERILKRIIVDPIHDAWLKYLKFAIYVVGVSSGVRIHDLERYISPSQYAKDAKILELNAERWVLEIYRTVIETLQGVAWLLLVFFVFALMAYVVVRVFEMRGNKSQ